MRIAFKSIIGKTILVGMTEVNEDKEPLRRMQFFGVILKADNKKGISIKVESEGSEEFKVYNNKVFILPPDLRSISIAEKGVYSLKSTNEQIEDPDLLTSFTIYYHKH
ncbi:MAG: hypothetical protein HN948_01615 [Clostridia bacterium]|jgi:hypothetical protein|nr:hypothetical protein [Clostridia bacterium]MBT7121687.1 hypothetical protein [Clostridia bacterium]